MDPVVEYQGKLAVVAAISAAVTYYLGKLGIETTLAGHRYDNHPPTIVYPQGPVYLASVPSIAALTCPASDDPFEQFMPEEVSIPADLPIAQPFDHDLFQFTFFILCVPVALLSFILFSRGLRFLTSRAWRTLRAGTRFLATRGRTVLNSCCYIYSFLEIRCDARLPGLWYFFVVLIAIAACPFMVLIAGLHHIAVVAFIAFLISTVEYRTFMLVSGTSATGEMIALAAFYLVCACVGAWVFFRRKSSPDILTQEANHQRLLQKEMEVCKAISAAHKTLQAAHAELGACYTTLKDENTVLEGKYASPKVVHTDLKDEMAGVRNSLEAEVRKLKERNFALETAQAIALSSKRNLEAEVQKVKDEIRTLKQEYDSKLAQAETRASLQKDEIKRLKTQPAHPDDSIRAIQLEQLRKTHQRCASQIQSAKDSELRAQEQMLTARDGRRKAEKELSDLKHEHEALQRAEKNFDKRIESANRRERLSSDRYESILSRETSLDIEHGKLSGDYKALSADNSKLSTRLDETDRELGEAQVRLKNANHELGKLQGRFNLLSREHEKCPGTLRKSQEGHNQALEAATHAREATEETLEALRKVHAKCIPYTPMSKTRRQHIRENEQANATEAGKAQEELYESHQATELLTRRLSEHEKAVESLTVQRDDARDQRAAILTELDATLSERDAAVTERNAANEKLAVAQSDLVLFQNALQKLQSQQSTLKQEHSVLQNDLKALQAEHSKCPKSIFSKGSGKPSDPGDGDDSDEDKPPGGSYKGTGSDRGPGKQINDSSSLGIHFGSGTGNEPGGESDTETAPIADDLKTSDGADDAQSSGNIQSSESGTGAGDENQDLDKRPRKRAHRPKWKDFRNSALRKAGVQNMILTPAESQHPGLEFWNDKEYWQGSGVDDIAREAKSRLERIRQDPKTQFPAIRHRSNYGTIPSSSGFRSGQFPPGQGSGFPHGQGFGSSAFDTTGTLTQPSPPQQKPFRHPPKIPPQRPQPSALGMPAQSQNVIPGLSYFPMDTSTRFEPFSPIPVESLPQREVQGGSAQTAQTGVGLLAVNAPPSQSEALYDNDDHMYSSNSSDSDVPMILSHHPPTSLTEGWRVQQPQDSMEFVEFNTQNAHQPGDDVNMQGANAEREDSESLDLRRIIEDFRACGTFAPTAGQTQGDEDDATTLTRSVYDQPPHIVVTSPTDDSLYEWPQASVQNSRNIASGNENIENTTTGTDSNFQCLGDDFDYDEVFARQFLDEGGLGFGTTPTGTAASFAEYNCTPNLEPTGARTGVAAGPTGSVGFTAEDFSEMNEEYFAHAHMDYAHGRNTQGDLAHRGSPEPDFFEDSTSPSNPGGPAQDRGHDPSRMEVEKGEEEEEDL